MDLESFYRLIEHPAIIGDKETLSLKNIVQDKPFFHVARVLYLKGLQNQNSYLYNQQLKETAAHMPDRGVLFDFIVEDYGNPNEVHVRHAEGLKSLEEYLDEERTVEAGLEAEIGSSEGGERRAESGRLESGSSEIGVAERNFKLEGEVEFEHSLSEIEQEDVTSELDTEITIASTDDANEQDIQPNEEVYGSPLNFSKDEIHTFEEWLTLVQVKPIDRSEERVEADIEEKPETSDNQNADENDLIDRFLENEPRISDVKKNNPPKPNLAEENLIEESHLMTETLARVYTLQGLHKKAIQAYKILLLKYPEKSGYFADQIREIEELTKEE